VARLAALTIAPADTPAFPESALPPGPPRDPRAQADTLSPTIAAHRVWTYNQKGFFYTSVAHPAQIYYHWARRPGKADVLLYESPDGPGASAHVELSDGGRYAVITAARASDTRTRVLFIDLDDADHPIIDAPAVKVFDDLDARYVFAGNYGSAFYVWTDLNAPLGRVVSINSDEPSASDVRVAAPPSPYPLVSARVAAGRVAATYLDAGRTTLRLVSPGGGFTNGHDVPLPGLGTVGTVMTGGSRKVDTLYYVYESVLSPPAVYSYDLHGAHSMPVRNRELPFDSSAYELRRVVDSGATSVTFYVVAPKSLALDGTHPTWVDTSATSSTAWATATLGPRLRYSPAAIVWLELGGVYAIPAKPGAAAARATADALVRHRYARPQGVTLAAPMDADALAALARLAWN
jgi:prolyl oligopeptidase